MKKIVLVLGFIIVSGICLGIFFYNPEKLTPGNSTGKTIYYTMIADPGVKGENGRYGYKLTVYTEDGKEKTLNFSARKQLKEGAYIQLYYTLIRGVTYWEEVTFEELPNAVQQQYQ